MRIVIDTGRQEMIVDEGTERQRVHRLYERESLELLSHYWLKAGWNCKYSYDFQWMGRPIIQMPDDIVRLQELIWSTRPTLILETGVAHGGSSIFFASMLELLGGGKVVAVDIEIRPHNRKALETHPLFSRLTLIEGSSIDPGIVTSVKELVGRRERVMVFLDSNHTKDHVARELEAYSSLVSPGCYLVAADGVMSLLTDVPRGQTHWATDNPREAVREFLELHPEFELDPSYTRTGVTYIQGGYLKRKLV